MGKKPFLSIIMPVFNAEKYLVESISSILKQKMQNFELILINDCSTDRSGFMCEEFSRKDDRISTITLEKNGGAGNARNIGMKVAGGEYITFIDSDDIIDEDLYLNAYHMAADHDLDMVVWGMTEEYYNEFGKCYCINQLYLEQCLCKNIEEIKSTVILLEEKTLFGYQCNRFYRADILKNNSIEFEKIILYEDYFFNLKVIEYVNSMGILKDCGYHYMKRQNQSITTKFVPEYFELSTRRIESMYQLYQQWNQYNDMVRNVLGERYLRYILAAIVKSYDKRAKFNNIQRKKMLRLVVKSDLYSVTAKKCSVKGVALRVLQVALNRKQWLICLSMGKTIWIIRERLPGTFNKIRRYKQQ